MQYIALLVTLMVMLAICGLIMWWFFYCKSKPKYTGYLWLHPDLGGKVIDVQKEPISNQNPFYFNYRKLEFGIPFFRRELYLWKQGKISDNAGKYKYPIIPWEPDKPADFGLQSTSKGEPDKSKPYVTPNRLFNKTDWAPLRVLETSESKITETIKLGVAVVMTCVCIFGIIVALDMIGKKEPASAPIQTSGKPMTQIIQPQNYGGLLIW